MSRIAGLRRATNAVLDVQRWAEIRRMRKAGGLSVHEIARRPGHDRNTVRTAFRADRPPSYRRHEDEDR